MSFIELLSGDLRHPPEISYEIIGLTGSAIMLCGVIYIKPIFLSLTASEKKQRDLVQKLQDSFSKIKTLSGLLPICASCKKIKDDKGYWNQIEGYIRDHSEAEFSHGLCPDCAKKMYSQFLNE